jgi:hypothetical protein
MMTAPRPVPTIERSLESYRLAGFDDIVEIYDDEDRQLGNLRNWSRALDGLLAQRTDFIAIMQDDITWALHSRDVLLAEMQEMGGMAHEAGYLSLHLFTRQAEEARTSVVARRWRNWHATQWGQRSPGAQCYVMPWRSARKLQRHADFRDLVDKSLAGYGDDRVVSKCMAAMKLPCWFRSPGLVHHVLGYGNSALAHKFKDRKVYWNPVAKVHG